MQACFIGHRVIIKNQELYSLLKKTTEELIHKGVTTFLFSDKGAFDKLSWEVVTELKKKYTFIERVYVRANYQYIDKSYEEYLLTFYEKTYFPPNLVNAGKSSYIKRNYEMINASSYCVFYYNKNYSPPLKHRSKLNYLPSLKSNSGTKLAYKYALTKRKITINMYT